MHDPKRTLFYVFNLSFEKNILFLALSLFLFKKVTSKKYLILFTFSLYFFSEFVFFFCVVSFCLLTLLLLFLFSFFYSMLPLLLFALFMFIYSLLCFFCWCLFLFFEKNWIYIIYFSFFVEKSLNFELVISTCKTLLVLSFFCFVPFSDCFFQWCSFEQDQVYLFFFLEAKTTCLTNLS